MAVDDQRVTDKLTLVASTTVDPKDGKICYAPAEGLSVGKHTAAIAVQAPRDASVPTAPTRLLGVRSRPLTLPHSPRRTRAHLQRHAAASFAASA